jgi:hypothetical protein
LPQAEKAEKAGSRDAPLPHTTITSKFPTPAPNISQLRDVFTQAGIGVCRYIEEGPDTNARIDEMNQLLTQFLQCPTITKHGLAPSLPDNSNPPPPQAPDTLSDLKEIKDTIKSLSKAIGELKRPTPPTSKPSPATTKPGPPPTPTTKKTYSAVAGSRSANVSIVVDLANMQFGLMGRPRPPTITECINRAIKDSPIHHIHISAVRWTAKDNLVVTGGPTVSAQLLQSASHIIADTLATAFSTPTTTVPLPSTRANIKWSKILINGLPTGVFRRTGPYSPNKCQAELVLENPS